MYIFYIMVDQCRRKIESVESDIEDSMQISSILLKLRGYDEKLRDLSKIGNNENNISSNLGKIDTNKNNIDGTKSNLSNIDFNSNNKYSIENFYIYNIKIENNYTLNKDTPNFSIFKYTLEDDFKSNSILEINCKLLYDYTTYNNIGALMHIFKLYDENNNLLYEYKNLKTNAGDNLKKFNSN